MTPSGDTWGISGPMFLLVYVVLAVLVTVAVVRMRRTLADVPVTRFVGRLDELPYDVAYLNGGAELALCAALSAMHRNGTIATAGRGTVVGAARPEPRADELERAVHHAAVVPIPRRQLAATGAVASALHRSESRLVGVGLLLNPERRARSRATAGWTFALALLGVARVVAGIGNGRPVGFVAMLTVVVVVVGVAQGVGAPRRSRAGDGSGRRVSVSALQPGDLVFYGSPVHHVALYVGGGQVIHAPQTGDVVRYASVDMMPIAGAVRP